MERMRRALLRGPELVDVGRIAVPPSEGSVDSTIVSVPNSRKSRSSRCIVARSVRRSEGASTIDPAMLPSRSCFHDRWRACVDKLETKIPQGAPRRICSRF